VRKLWSGSRNLNHLPRGRWAAEPAPEEGAKGLMKETTTRNHHSSAFKAN